MLEVSRVFKTYEGKPLLNELSLVVKPGQTVCLLGASGSGKSTLLRMIAGVEQPDQGEICWNGKSILQVPIHLRHFGLMFQDYALFPHLNVFDNVAFGLRMQRIDSDEISPRVVEALGQVGMQTFAQREITDLSGGEQQRVALARTLATRPRLLMLDEPLAALDRSLRQQLLAEIRRILKETGIPSIYVTHDQEEAYIIADQVMLLGSGQIVQSGTPEQVFSYPNSLAVAAFLGMKNTLRGKIVRMNPVVIVDTDLGRISVQVDDQMQDGLDVGDDVILLLRQADLLVPDDEGRENVFSGMVEDAYFQESGYLASLKAGGNHFIFNLKGYQPGQDQVQFRLPKDSIQIYHK